MFNNKNLVMLVTLLILMAVVPTMTLANGSAKFAVPRTLLIAGSQIKSGDYDVKWQSHSPEAEVMFTVDGHTALRSRARL